MALNELSWQNETIMSQTWQCLPWTKQFVMDDKKYHGVSTAIFFWVSTQFFRLFEFYFWVSTAIQKQHEPNLMGLWYYARQRGFTREMLYIQYKGYLFSYMPTIWYTQLVCVWLNFYVVLLKCCSYILFRFFFVLTTGGAWHAQIARWEAGEGKELPQTEQRQAGGTGECLHCFSFLPQTEQR